MEKIVLITGATDGIGKEVATQLAQKGYHVLLHGRNAVKAAQVQQAIITETGNQNVTPVIADLFDLQAVQAMAEKIRNDYDRLDVLINNAGAYLGKVRRTNAAGLEHTLTLNVLAPFLLTNLLLPLIQKSPAGRIVNTSSAMHRRAGRPDFEDFQFAHDFEPARAYAISKLYVIWLTRHWAQVLADRHITNVTVNASHPGAVATNFGLADDKGWLPNLIFKLAPMFESTPAKGAQTTVYLADSPAVATVTGAFFNQKKKRERPNDRYYSAAAEQAVWDHCLALVKPYLD
ncbi:ketoreductase [Lactiplantibacillus fabifermentans T30PCM01]|uniref:Ketoreductase n=1 Tax=Lactiplantibacillus fabifermentans T30PCM01 TaxID=1400520 RepID=W6T3S8_9LACO|nr:SDR family NAD(P)-dependent oxidoreductase [Lactiplantibacillus fabifermentans]ETY72546.1 ketoreductase [Lactiplantibacillus fabifermentans T30PCM01]